MNLIPHDIEIERGLLGGLLLNQNEYAEISELFSDELFYDHKNKLVAKAIISLKNANKSFDILSVVNWLKEKGFGNAVEPYDVSSLTSKGIVFGFIDKVVLLNQFWIRRAVIEKNTKAINHAAENTCDVFELLGEQEKNLNDIIKKISVGKTYDAMDCAIEMNEHLAKLDKLNEGQLIGIDTGFPKLNEITAGFQKTDLIILAGRPGMGKTSLLLNFVQAALACNKPTLVFSIEMSKLQLYARMCSQRTGIPLYKFLKVRMSEGERMIYNQETYNLANSPMFIEDKGGIDMTYIKSKSRKLKRDKGIEFIVIDYLQIINKAKSNKSTNDQISEISGGLKELAKELEVPIIALSQLTREGEKTPDKRPALVHLRDGGSIEQDADMVMFVYRPEYYGITDDGMGNSTIGKGEIIIAKHRNGALDDIMVNFDGKCTNFY